MLDTLELIRNVLLVVVLLISAVTDLRDFKVYNVVVVPAAIASLVLASVGGIGGSLEAVLGLVVGGALLWPFYRKGGIGGGDVKLLAFVGATQGVEFVLNTALLAALVGGLWALYVLVRARQLLSGVRVAWALFRRTVGFARRQAPVRTLEVPAVPYAVCIALGGVAASVAQSALWQG